MFKKDLLKRKRILITGGGTGLGKEIAAKYLELGAELWLCGRRGAGTASTAKELVARPGGGVRTHSVDIRDAAAGGAMGPRLWGENGPVTRPGTKAPRELLCPVQEITPDR